MQKKLLGMAVAAAMAAPAVALAQSSVQVYGTAHLSINSVKFSESSAAGAAPSMTKMGVASHASNFGLRSTETLGGGLTAWFQAEFNMQMARNNGVFDGEATSRNQGVGLRGGFGNVFLGTWETPWTQTFRLWDVGTVGGWGPTTSIIGRRENTGTNPSRNCANNSGAAGGAVLTAQSICGNGAEASVPGTGIGPTYSLWRRYGQAIHYESPSFAGVQAKVAYAPNDRKAEGTGIVTENPSSWSASLTWAGMGGRARAFVATMQAKDWSTVGKTDSGYNVGGGYDFGVVNIGATYETYKYKGVGTTASDVTAKEYGIGVAVPAGPGAVKASYAKAKSLENVAGQTGAKMWNVGYELALSKRTAVGFGIAKMDNDANAGFSWTNQVPNQNGAQSGAVAAGVDQQNIFVSLRHSF